jgi:hypothetical protein
MGGLELICLGFFDFSWSFLGVCGIFSRVWGVGMFMMNIVRDRLVYENKARHSNRVKQS